MRFPKTIKHRRSRAVIYGRSANYPFYRVAFYSGGKRKVQSFRKYGDALAAAEKAVKDLSIGSQAGELTTAQARASLNAFARLQDH